MQRVFQSGNRTADVEVATVGEARVRVHRPPTMPGEPAPGLLWLHSGGYVMGQAAQEDAACRRFASELGAVVVAVDYRLAPEHPFPQPLQDCHDALVWMANLDEVDETRIAVGGASAGAGLAAAVALMARDQRQVCPVFQLLAYPMLDDRTAVAPTAEERYVRLWNTSSNHFGWRSYLGRDPGGPTVSPLAAPARAEDLSGLPPAWVGVGTLDLFCDEDRAYATRLRAAGVPCDLELVEGAFHGFDAIRPTAPVSQRFRRAQVEALAGAIGIRRD
jgi:acetyl esterase/lipase